jgi:hypothetical protein
MAHHTELRLAFYFFAFLRAELDFVVGFFLVDTLLLTAFLMAALGAGLEVEPDRRSSTAAPAASGRVSSPFKAFATCSLPAAIVFDKIRLIVPRFVAMPFSLGSLDRRWDCGIPPPIRTS